MDQYEINNGSSAVFQCEASAVPDHNVFWTFTNFNGSTVFIIDTTLPDTDKYQIRRMRGVRAGFGELTVLNVQYEDRGMYTCTAVNIIGFDMSDANLIVFGGSCVTYSILRDCMFDLFMLRFTTMVANKILEKAEPATNSLRSGPYRGHENNSFGVGLSAPEGER